MARPLLTDELWAVIEPILPRRRAYPKGGRPAVGDREALTGILFVLKTGIPWEDLPQELGCGCGMTCWRRLRDWEMAGIWKDLHHVLLNRLHGADRIDWSRSAADSASVRAVFGGPTRGQTPRIGPRPARSTTCSRTATVFPWRPSSRRPTATMSPN